MVNFPGHPWATIFGTLAFIIIMSAFAIVGVYTAAHMWTQGAVPKSLRQVGRISIAVFVGCFLFLAVLSLLFGKH